METHIFLNIAYYDWGNVILTLTECIQYEGWDYFEIN